MAFINMLRVRHTQPTAVTPIQSATRFIFNKNDNMGPVNLTIGGNTYTCEGYSAENPLFHLYDDGTFFGMCVAYKNGITAANYTTGAELYEFLRNATVTLTRESDGYGWRWSGSSYVGGYVDSGVADWARGFGSAASETTDSTDTIWSNLTTAYNNGDNLVVEFTANA